MEPESHPECGKCNVDHNMEEIFGPIGKCYYVELWIGDAVIEASLRIRDEDLKLFASRDRTQARIDFVTPTWCECEEKICACEVPENSND